MTTPLRLATGWNLVSYLPANTLPVTQALASIAGKYTTVLLGYDKGATSFYTSIPPPLQHPRRDGASQGILDQDDRAGHAGLSGGGPRCLGVSAGQPAAEAR